MTAWRSATAALALAAVLALGGCTFCRDHERTCDIAAGIAIGAVAASAIRGEDEPLPRRPICH